MGKWLRERKRRLEAARQAKRDVHISIMLSEAEASDLETMAAGRPLGPFVRELFFTARDAWYAGQRQGLPSYTAPFRVVREGHAPEDWGALDPETAALVASAGRQAQGPRKAQPVPSESEQAGPGGKLSWD